MVCVTQAERVAMAEDEMCEIPLTVYGRLTHCQPMVTGHLEHRINNTTVRLDIIVRQPEEVIVTPFHSRKGLVQTIPLTSDM